MLCTNCVYIFLFSKSDVTVESAGCREARAEKTTQKNDEKMCQEVSYRRTDGALPGNYKNDK